MDIVVTIPKNEYLNNLRERVWQIENNGFGFRVFKNKPKHIKIGDRIYFVREKKVCYSKKIFDIKNVENEDIDCSVTDRNWKGNWQVCFNDERDESHLNISCKGFQGFRYKWWDK